MPTSEQQEHYVDPIIFSEGAYRDRADYEQSIDGFVKRINSGVALPIGREPKSAYLEADALQDAIQESLIKMPAEVRQVLELYYFRSLESDVIAEELHLPIKTVENRLATALRLLTEAFEPKPNLADWLLGLTNHRRA